MAHPSPTSGYASERHEAPASRRAAGSLADRAAMVQSRETGDVLPGKAASPFAKSWVHFVAGG